MVELRLLATPAFVEAVSDALIDELGALSVSVEDADADGPAEEALFGEPDMPPPAAGWNRSVLRALFEDEAAATDAATLLLAHPWEDADALHLQGLAPVNDQDWVRLTQQQFAPVPVTDGFWIVPSWHETPSQARCVIRLDPGLAFGTGTHPTTRMCLRWIAEGAADAGWRRAGRVLDYGCGSGILAIAAALHGAGRVLGVDIDEAAVAATRANAQANGVAIEAALPDQALGVHDLVLANILATPLTLLAPLLSARVAPGGWLVLAGILERQTEALCTAYAPWIELAPFDRSEGWVLLAGRREPALPSA
jgi:ribosomal protein L11 methyltransferase